MEPKIDHKKKDNLKKLLAEADIPMSDFSWTNSVMEKIATEESRISTQPLISLKAFLLFFVLVFGLGFVISTQINPNFGLIDQFDKVFDRVSSPKIDFSVNFELSPLVTYGLLSFSLFFALIVMNLSRKKG